MLCMCYVVDDIKNCGMCIQTPEHKSSYLILYGGSCINRDRRGRDRMVVEFTTTYSISAYHH
jgi:hypothetical protein